MSKKATGGLAGPLRYRMLVDDGSEQWTYEANSRADIDARRLWGESHGETCGPVYVREDLCERMRAALIAVREWEASLMPADGIRYGSYYPAFAVNGALDEDGPA